MDTVFLILAFLAGAGGPVQAGVNVQLRAWTKDPVLAAMISFAVGTLALLLYALIFRIPTPDVRYIRDVPWWAWTGGIYGAFLVAVSVVLAPTLGAATLMALIVAGQLTGGLLLDHFGVLGYQTHPITLWRLVGGLLIVCGVIIIRRF